MSQLIYASYLSPKGGFSGQLHPANSDCPSFYFLTPFFSDYQLPPETVTGLSWFGRSIFYYPEGLVLSAGGLGSGTGLRNLRERKVVNILPPASSTTVHLAID